MELRHRHKLIRKTSSKICITCRRITMCYVFFIYLFFTAKLFALPLFAIFFFRALSLEIIFLCAMTLLGCRKNFKLLLNAFKFLSTLF
jgi:hypothetical protein